ncbi:MAG: ABC transporter ATP-binding protein [bacterium]
MINVDNLAKFYGSVEAVCGISFDVQEGEIIGFLGPNGAGKSTTMKILTGYMPASSGSAHIAGYDVSQDPLNVQKNLGYLPENNPLYPEMTVKAYLDYSASIKGLTGLEKNRSIGSVIEKCGLANVESRVIGHLSKGYRQRVGLAQALVNDPPVMLLDEPTSGLDPAQIVEIRNLIKDLKGNRTIMLSTHILPEVNMVCDRVVIIHQGRLAASGELDSLADSMNEKNRTFLSVLGQEDNFSNVLKEIDGVENVRLRGMKNGEVHYEVDSAKDLRASLASAVYEKSGKLTEIRKESITLEEIFVKIVSGETGSVEESGDE